MEAMSEAVRPLQAGLDRIMAAVQRLAGDQKMGERAVHIPAPTELLEEEGKRQDQGQEAAHQEEVTSALDPPRMPERVPATMPLLSALRELQQARARSVQPARDVLEAVIERAEQEREEQDHQINVQSIERILRDLDRLDAEFLREVHQRVPAMTKVLAQLRERGVSDFVTASQLDPIVADVEALHEVAKALHAATITMFLQGVKSFLTMTAYRKMTDLDHRLEAVEERLNALIPMAEQWASLGRLERAAIEEILPT